MTVMPTGALTTGGVSGVGGKRVTTVATGALQATGAASEMRKRSVCCVVVVVQAVR